LFLEKAHRLLGEAEAMLTIGLNEAGGRTAYLAGFHAAQALISEMTDRAVKTHRGVQAELLRLIKDRTDFDAGLRTFLSKNYDLKTIADYETGMRSIVSAERAAVALQGARHFVAYISKLIPSV
jgi:uncharacterized protein (UPF0332 family)